MKVKKDSLLNVSSPDFDMNTGWILADKLEVDSLFYFGYSGLNTERTKVMLEGNIFFDKDNGFEWYTADGNKKTVGILQSETWYMFSQLKTEPYEILIYIDCNDQIHRFNKLASNF
jgi:hypothetical protein